MERIASPKRDTIDLSSRFFQGGSSRDVAAARKGNVNEKENEPILVEDSDNDIDEDTVDQEDGYISPSPSISRLVTPELSSPVRAGHSKGPNGFFEEMLDDLSSPVLRRCSNGIGRPELENMSPMRAQVLVERTPEQDEPPSLDFLGPDIGQLLDDDSERTSDIFCNNEDMLVPATQCSSTTADVHGDDIDELWEEEATQKVQAEALSKVLKGWREKYSFDHSTPVRLRGPHVCAYSLPSNLKLQSSRHLAALSIWIRPIFCFELEQTSDHSYVPFEVAAVRTISNHESRVSSRDEARVVYRGDQCGL